MNNHSNFNILLGSVDIILSVLGVTATTTTMTRNTTVHASSLLQVEQHPPNPKRVKGRRRRKDDNHKIVPSSIEFKSKHAVAPEDLDASPIIVLARIKNDPVGDMAVTVGMSIWLWIQQSPLCPCRSAIILDKMEVGGVSMVGMERMDGMSTCVYRRVSLFDVYWSMRR